ncbi:MAG: amidase, partial [Rhodobacteraceae bacterium]|nr:amidase [Paracoccaceae bacterium]
MSDTWLWMTAADLGRAFEAGEIDPREATEVYLSAIESHPQAPGIYARVTADRARAEADAAAARARAGLRRGPL